MPFVKGQSGNPAGRPRGCQNRINRDFDVKLLENGDYLADNLFKLFTTGNATALRLVTQRLSPVTKGRPIEIDLPPLKSPADRPAAVEVINRALGEGEITIEEASDLIGYVDKALGFDHAAVAKAQLVALMREVISLRTQVALMAERLDAELGVDNINAESTIDAAAAAVPAAPHDETPALVNNKENTSAGTESTAGAAPRAETTAPVNNRENTGAETDRVIRDPEMPDGMRSMPITIGDDVLALMQELEQLQINAPPASDAAAGRMLAERTEAQAA